VVKIDRIVIFKMAAATVLDFQKFQNLTVCPHIGLSHQTATVQPVIYACWSKRAADWLCFCSVSIDMNEALIVNVFVASNVSTTIDPFWDISLDLGPPDFQGWFSHCP